jgi:hypothetical protein
VAGYLRISYETFTQIQYTLFHPTPKMKKTKQRHKKLSNPLSKESRD